MKTLYLLDAMALAYRAHFIFISRPLINSKGKNTSAAYGFTTALLKLIETHNIEHVAVVFDAVGAGGTFRDEMYASYKAHREPPPEDLLWNLPYIKKIVQALDIPVIEEVGVEADDVIGTLARKAEADGHKSIILSPDKDFQQLLSPAISIYKPSRRGEEFEPVTDETFREKYGVDPIQFIDILALMGDSADNVPGVHGIGPKTASKLIQQYGSVENLLVHAAEVKGKKAREGLLAYHDEALLSKKLVTILIDLDVPLDWNHCRRHTLHEAQLVQLFNELEFNTLFNRIRKQLGKEEPVPGQQMGLFAANDPALEFDFGEYESIKEYNHENVDYTILYTQADLDGFLSELAQQERFAFDTETTSVDVMWASLVGMSFSWKHGQGVYIPTPLPDGTSTESILDQLKPLLQGRKIVGQNLKYDLSVMKRHGVDITADLFDTMVAHYLIAPEAAHDLDYLARTYLNYQMVPISSLIGKGKNQISMRDVPIEEAGPYACEDADISLQLADLLEEELKEKGVTRIAEEIEFPLIPVLVEMELAGIHVDLPILKEIDTQLRSEILRLEGEIYEAAGEIFKIGSTQQLGHILFEKLGMRVVAKTGKGKPSTRESVLQELATEHPLPGLILDWRQLSKLKSTYVDNLSKLIHPETRRVHGSFNQTVAATGRLSSTKPNLQNIPVRRAMGREIRKAFVPEAGNTLLAADYVQIELRILASLSDDAALKKAFNEGADIHTSAAALVFNVEPEDVTRDMRRKAKEVNYGIPYGVSAFGLAQRLRSSRMEAQELIDQYQQSYPQVTRYLALQVERAREKGYVETILGRRRYVPGINARNRNERSFAERVAVNMPIQGTQADMIKIAMVRLNKRLKQEGLKSRMILQVHDELVFEAPLSEVETLSVIVREEMVQALPIDVPVTVDIGTGENWLDAH